MTKPAREAVKNRQDIPYPMQIVHGHTIAPTVHHPSAPSPHQAQPDFFPGSLKSLSLVGSGFTQEAGSKGPASEEKGLLVWEPGMRQIEWTPLLRQLNLHNHFATSPGLAW